MIIFKILLICLLALPFIALVFFLFSAIKVQNDRIQKREEALRELAKTGVEHRLDKTQEVYNSKTYRRDRR